MHLSRLINKVLLIDDDADDCLLFEDALNKIAPGTTLRSAQTYTEAIAILATYLPDIIFIDINMSQKNGFECVEALMSHPLFRTIPVVMHSSSANPTHIAQAYSFGANLYFKKPSHFEVLVMGLRKVLELDWMHPKRVTAAQYSNGLYAAFKVA